MLGNSSNESPRLTARKGSHIRASLPLSLRIIEPRLAPEGVAHYKYQICGAFCQAPHKIGIPLRAIGNIDTHVVALLHQFFLQVAADTIEHLELEG